MIIERTETLRHTITISAICMLVFSRPASADLAEMARDILESSGDAVITIEIVSETKVNYGGRESTQEQKQEALGIVISESGAVVTALSSVDPSRLYENMRRPGMDFDFSASVKSMKYILADNTEIPAKIVLRDSDQDMAFLVPEENVEDPFTFIDLSRNAEPEMLSEAFSIARMGRIARRTPALMSGEIQGIVRRPRPYYIPSAELASGGTGVPVFSADGTLYGVILLHSQPGFSSDVWNEEPYIPVVVPAVDIGTAAAQMPSSEDE